MAARSPWSRSDVGPSSSKYQYRIYYVSRMTSLVSNIRSTRQLGLGEAERDRIPPPRLPLCAPRAPRRLRGFGIFLACIVLGVATIAGVGSVARGMTEGLANEGRAILGGDIAVTLLQREATPEERAWLEARGTVSEVATLRAIARTRRRRRPGAGRAQGRRRPLSRSSARSRSKAAATCASAPRREPTACRARSPSVSS